MADREIQTYTQSKWPMDKKLKLNILPVRCQANALPNSEEKMEVIFFYHRDSLKIKLTIILY